MSRNYSEDRDRLVASRQQQEERTSEENATKRRGITLPIQVSAQEIITIAGIVISLALAWGTFQTKISLLEQINVMQNEKIRDLQSEIKTQSATILQLRDEVREHHIILDAVKSAAKK